MGDRSYRIVNAVREDGTALRVITDGIPLWDESIGWKDMGDSCASIDSPKVRRSLYRTFAGLRDNEGTVLSFAGRYGYLTGGNEVFLRTHADGSHQVLLDRSYSRSAPDDIADISGGYRCYNGERYESWRGEIRTMRRAVQLWDILRGGNAHNELKAHIEWNEEGVFFCDDHYKELIAGREARTHLLEKFNSSRVILPAWYLLQMLINYGLDAGFSVRLEWEKDGTLRLRERSATLLGCMWKQLAEEIASFEADSPTRIAVCDICGHDFPCRRKRPKSSFCSGKCRQEAYRRSKRKALPDIQNLS